MFRGGGDVFFRKQAYLAVFVGLALFPAQSFAGTLYGGGGQLDSISTAGAITPIGGGTGITTDCNGFPCYSMGGLAFSGTKLYAALTNFSSSTSDFYAVDPSTGAATYLGNIPFDQVTGITGVASNEGVPEPSTCLLMVCGVLAIVLRRRSSARMV